MVTAFPATVALASPRSAPWARTGMAKAVNAARKARRFFIDNLRVTVSLRRDSRSTQPREAPGERRAQFCEPRYLRHRARRRFGPGERLQLELPPADVVPAPQLEPGGAEDARQAETQRLVQRHAGRVRQGDAREGAAVAEEPQRLEERRVERLSDATPPPGRAHVDRDLGRPLVGGRGPNRRARSGGNGRGRKSMPRPTDTIHPAREKACTSASRRAAPARARGAPPSRQARARSTMPSPICTVDQALNIQRLISEARWRSTSRRSAAATGASRAVTSAPASAPATRSAVRKLTVAIAHDAARNPSQTPAVRMAARSIPQDATRCRTDWAGGRADPRR